MRADLRREVKLTRAAAVVNVVASPSSWTQSRRAGRCPAALALVALGLLPALPGQVSADVAEPVGDEPLYAAPTRPDRIGRMLAAVEVNGSGPYRFILDTGANRSVLSARLAEALGLVQDDASMVEVHGVTGPATVPSARVAELRIGEIVLQDQEMPVLTGPVFAGSDGILGIDGLLHARIEVDFTRDRVSISHSDGSRIRGNYLTVPARLMNRGLLLVSGKVGGVPAHVVIDTGAERTVGNLRLQEALTRVTRGKDGQGVSVLGATPGAVDGIAYALPAIKIGEARMSNLPVTFGDLHVFSLWGLNDEPTLLVGMDVLGTLQKFIVDYPRREFHIRPRAPNAATIRRCNSAGCATRLPPPES